MNGLEITKELKNDIEINQIQLQNAIRNHQELIVKLKDCSDKNEIIQKIKTVEEDIIQIGFEQKKLLDRLREEYKAYQKSLKQNTIKSAIEEKRFILTSALNRARKQHFLPRNHSSPLNSFSDDSDQRKSPQFGSEIRPVDPHELSQSSFLGYFRLATHEVYREMQKKRAERKRRSTANPQFLYGNKGWDFLGPPAKKKRSHFLAHPPSPPNTRGRKRQEMQRSKSKSPPSSFSNNSVAIERFTNGNQPSQKSDIKSAFPSIPNLPSGLIIERVSPGRSSPDTKQCIMCKQPGALSICEQCTNGFHISCHNRPFAKTPRECPKCLSKETRRSGSAYHNPSSGPSFMRQRSVDLTEKINLKHELEEQHQNLVAELTQLQNRHSELTISLKNQESEQDDIILNHNVTKTKVNQILKFIEIVKNMPVQEKNNS
ncbi:PHD finger protein 21A [Sitophilus oryzae]|uniref:PHD finger protein 21A n=1 Tax=Sitophilus oryzae TaxID=7048 RepID=A0A6J2YX62_SITOR|nr:PHD finger protein 21A [Sitophilus oryzae]